ncbi:MAG: D-alanine--D-alanine ligase [Nitrospinae bacterium]|nr:D-alanine--D-alanine ligase [Nitrospinota bacterium]
MAASRLRVAVLFGGRSGEHEVSLSSARSVIAALNPAKYEIIPIGITPAGRWFAEGDPLEALASGESPDPEGLTLIPGDPTVKGLLTLAGADHKSTTIPIDVVFPVLHGPYGEDGTVQGLLELAGLPYVGGGVTASAAGMDKAIMKACFAAAGLPLLPSREYKRKRWEAERVEILDEVEAAFDYPIFVKPTNLGSSVGISKAKDRPGLEQAIDVAAQYDRKLIIEQGIECRELECSVLGNDEPIASVVGEVITTREFYDYEAKYFPGGCELIIPAEIDEAVDETVRDYALRAFIAVDCAGLGRVDMLMERATGQVYVNEINTIPGFTATSAYPKLFEAAGIGYGELVDRLIELALERHADKARSKTTFRPGEDA